MRFIQGALRAINYTPTPPPGTEANISQVLGWAAWIGLAVVILGFMVAGIMMAIANKTGRSAEHVDKVAWVIVGAIVISAGSAIASAIMR